MKTVYGINYYDNGHSSDRITTTILVGTKTSNDIPDMVKEYLCEVTTKPCYGVIKELTFDDCDNERINKAAQMGAEKLQGFILKRKGDEITTDIEGEKTIFFVNGQKNETLSCGKYDVTIIEID